MKKSEVKLTLIPFVLVLLLISTMQADAQRRKRSSTPEASGFELTSQMLNVQSFRSLGPAAYSGRISDLAVNPNDYSEYYVGVASGGLWKTINHGTTFEPIFDDQPVFSIVPRLFTGPVTGVADYPVSAGAHCRYIACFLSDRSG